MLHMISFTSRFLRKSQVNWLAERILHVQTHYFPDISKSFVNLTIFGFSFVDGFKFLAMHDDYIDVWGRFMAS